MMLIVFLGPPGAGKGTQAERLAKWLSIPHLSTGELLRQEMEANSEIGQRAAEFMQQGQLVPDDLIIDMVTKWLNEHRHEGGAILDGFPRTVPQAESLDRALSAMGERIDCVIKLTVDADELRKRLLNRGRLDDHAEAIEKRLVVYGKQTRPLIDYYAQHGVLEEIDGMGTPEQVFERIQEAVSRRGCRERT